MLRRPKLHSRHGCVPCKQRKKKCDEVKPSCNACIRLELACCYDENRRAPRGSRGAVDLGPMELPSVTYQAQMIQTRGIMDGREQNILHEIPKTLPLFWAPTSSKASRDLQVLQQMVAEHDIVRDSMIACFSEFLLGGEEAATVKHRALDRTLNQLRVKLRDDECDRKEGMQVKMAMNFIGMMEAINPGTDIDLLEHWRGVTAFTLRWERTGMHRWRLLPWREYLLCQESLLFHVSILSMFSRKFEYIHTTWKDSGISQRLEALNPEGPERVANSLLLSGQYFLFEMALEVTHRFRSPGGKHVAPEDVDDMRAMIAAKQEVLEYDFGLLPGSDPETGPEFALCRAYHLFCNALQICILALSTPSPQRVDGVDRLVSESIRGFERLREVLMASKSAHCAHILWMALWPFQILMCATRLRSDVDALAGQFKVLSNFLDEGSCVRTEALFGQVRRAIDGEVDGDVTKGFPIGLSLLRKPQGVLA